MNYVAQIRVYGDADKIARAFEPEINKKDRSEFKIEKQKDYVLFDISAKDSVALRATLNSITKLLTAFEKIEDM